MTVQNCLLQTPALATTEVAGSTSTATSTTTTSQRIFDSMSIYQEKRHIKEKKHKFSVTPQPIFFSGGFGIIGSVFPEEYNFCEGFIKKNRQKNENFENFGNDENFDFHFFRKSSDLVDFPLRL